MFSSAFQTAVKNGNAYSWTNVDYNYDAGDTILLVANIHTGGWKLNIERIDISSDTATAYVVHSPAYPTLAGTVVTGVNQNRDSSETALALAYADETGNTQANVLGGGHAQAADSKSLWMAVKLGYQKCIAVDLVDVGTGAIVSIFGYYSQT